MPAPDPDFLEKWLLHNARELDARLYEMDTHPLFRAYSRVWQPLSRLRARLRGRRGAARRDLERYAQWSEQRSAEVAAELEARSREWTFRPEIHFVISGAGDARRLMESISAQRYDRWRVLPAGEQADGDPVVRSCRRGCGCCRMLWLQWWMLCRGTAARCCTAMENSRRRMCPGAARI
jgi:hypothetical protein